MQPAPQGPRVSDFLPAAGRSTIVVIDPTLAHRPLLNSAERAQAERFHFTKDAEHWTACRSALRRVLGEALGIDPATLSLEFGLQGKPQLPASYQSLHFNLSHCADLALLALCQDGPVGIDLEPVDRATSLLGCESSFCHPEEIATLPTAPDDRARTLLDLWTAKEAALKALGTGLSIDPASFSLAGLENGSIDEPRLHAFRFHRPEHPILQHHVVCLAAPHGTAAPDFRILLP